jgi:polyhydroxyalkanoate synthesis regulator phasin
MQARPPAGLRPPSDFTVNFHRQLRGSAAITMNRLYLLVPIVLLALFCSVHWQHTRTVASTAAAQAAAVAAAQQAELAKKAAAEKQARADAAKRTAERLAEEAARDAAKRARTEEEARRIATDTAACRAQVAALTAEVSALQNQLADLQARRATLNTDAFALAKSVELTRIAHRTAELEIQRLNDLVARQVAATTLAR